MPSTPSSKQSRWNALACMGALVVLACFWAGVGGTSASDRHFERTVTMTVIASLGPFAGLLLEIPFHWQVALAAVIWGAWIVAVARGAGIRIPVSIHFAAALAWCFVGVWRATVAACAIT